MHPGGGACTVLGAFHSHIDLISLIPSDNKDPTYRNPCCLFCRSWKSEQSSIAPDIQFIFWYRVQQVCGVYRDLPADGPRLSTDYRRKGRWWHFPWSNRIRKVDLLTRFKYPCMHYRSLPYLDPAAYFTISEGRPGPLISVSLRFSMLRVWGFLVPYSYFTYLEF